jgi:hypothetical protein
MNAEGVRGKSLSPLFNALLRSVGATPWRKAPQTQWLFQVKKRKLDETLVEVSHFGRASFHYASPNCGCKGVLSISSILGKQHGLQLLVAGLCSIKFLFNGSDHSFLYIRWQRNVPQFGGNVVATL